MLYIRYCEGRPRSRGRRCATYRRPATDAFPHPVSRNDLEGRKLQDDVSRPREQRPRPLPRPRPRHCPRPRPRPRQKRKERDLGNLTECLFGETPEHGDDTIKCSRDGCGIVSSSQSSSLKVRTHHALR